jgi:hypothetical protein
MLYNCIWILSATIIYLHSFYHIGNTIYRNNHENNYTLQLGAIFESFRAPLRIFTLYNKEYGTFWFITDYKLTNAYIQYFFHFSNPLFTFPFFYLLFRFFV